jgi:histidine triad (HIT) family protein
MTDCTFCKILSNEFSSSRVFENDSVIAFLDIHPVNEGHVLVIPRRHVESFTDLHADEVAQISKCGQLVAKHLKKSLPMCKGISLSLADGVIAGQEVPHTHLHVIPRKDNDGFGWRLPPEFGAISEREKLDSVAKLVRESISGEFTS